MPFNAYSQPRRSGFALSSTRQLLLGLAGHIPGRRKRQLLLLGVVNLASALAELVSLGAVLPFLAILTDPGSLWNQQWIKRLALVVGWNSPDELLLPAACVFCFAALSAAAIRLINFWLTGQLAAAIGSDLSSEAYRRTLYQPYAVHLQRNSSDVINAITGQISVAVGAVALFLNTLSSTLISFALLVGLFVVDWQVSVIAMSVLAFSYVLIGWFSRRALLANGRVISQSRALVLKALQEGLGAIREVLLDGTQPIYIDIYKQSERPLRQSSARNAFLPVIPRFALEAVGMVSIAILAIILVNQ